MTIDENLCVTARQYRELHKLGYDTNHTQLQMAISWVEDWLWREHRIAIFGWVVTLESNGKIRWGYTIRAFDKESKLYIGLGTSKESYNRQAMRRWCINQAIRYLKQK